MIALFQPAVVVLVSVLSVFLPRSSSTNVSLHSSSSFPLASSERDGPQKASKLLERPEDVIEALRSSVDLIRQELDLMKKSQTFEGRKLEEVSDLLW